jgi:hypothetical protein
MKFSRIVDYLVFILFALFAYLQLNDSDGWCWIVIYMLTAFTAIVYNRIPPILVRSLAFLIGIGLLTFIPDLIDWAREGFPSITGSMQADNPMTEFVREAGGMVLALITLIFYTKKADKK